MKNIIENIKGRAIFASVLCLLSLVLFAPSAQAENVAAVKSSTGTVKGNYATVQDAVTAAASGDTVVLTADSTNNVTVSGKTITLDLNGKTLTGGDKAKSTVKVESGAGLTIDDTSAGGLGKITTYVPASLAFDPCCADGAGVYSAGDLTILGGSVTGCIGGHIVTAANWNYQTFGKKNYKAVHGAGVYVAGGTITVGGTAKIYDNNIRTCYKYTYDMNWGTGPLLHLENIYLPKGMTLQISTKRPLQPGARIGVTTAELPANETTVAITSNGSESDVQYFESNIKRRSVHYVGGKLVLKEDPKPVADETMMWASNDWQTKYNPFAEPTTLPHWISNLCWHKEWTNSMGQTQEYGYQSTHGLCAIQPYQRQGNWFLAAKTYYSTTNEWLSAGRGDPDCATNIAYQAWLPMTYTTAKGGNTYGYMTDTLLSRFSKKFEAEHPKGSKFSDDKAGVILSRAFCTLLRRHEMPPDSWGGTSAKPYIMSAIAADISTDVNQKYAFRWESSWTGGPRLDGYSFYTPMLGLNFKFAKNTVSDMLKVLDEGGTLATSRTQNKSGMTGYHTFNEGYGTALTNAISCLDEFPADWEGEHLLAGKDNAEAKAKKMDWPIFDEDVHVDRGDVLLMKFACHAARVPIKFLRAYRLTGDGTLFDKDGKYLPMNGRTEQLQLYVTQTNALAMYPGLEHKREKSFFEFLDLNGRFENKPQDELYATLTNLTQKGLCQYPLERMDMQGRIEYMVWSFFNEMPTMLSKIERPEQLEEARKSLKEAIRCYLNADAFIFGRGSSKTGDKIVGKRDVNKLHLFELVEEPGAEWNASAWRYIAEQLWESVNGEKATEIDLVKLGKDLNIRQIDHVIDFSGLGPNRDGKISVNANAVVTGGITRKMVKNDAVALSLKTYDKIAVWHLGNATWPPFDAKSTNWVDQWIRSGWLYNQKIKLTLNEDTVDKTLGGIYPAGTLFDDLATMKQRYPGDGDEHYYQHGTVSRLSGFAERLEVAATTRTVVTAAMSPYVLEEGKVYTAVPTTENGGAFNVNSGATLTGENVTIADNQTTASGGAIYNQGTVTLKDAAFQGNKAGQSGGAIYNCGTVNFDGAVTLATTNDTIYNTGTLNWNLAGGKAGVLNGYDKLINNGGTLQLTVEDATESPALIATGDFSTLTGKDTFTVKNGAATITVKIGGEMVLSADALTGYKLVTEEAGETTNLVLQVTKYTCAREEVKNGSKVLEEGKIYTAAPTTQSGGAFKVSNGVTLICTNMTFAANATTVDGGAIYNSGTVTLKDMTFTGNKARLGGAILNSALFGKIGTVNFDGAVTLATETDTIVNRGTLNWNLTDGKAGVLNGYQNVTNEGILAKLQLTVEDYATLPKTMVIATGDFSNVEGKDTFTVTNVTSGAMGTVKIGDTTWTVIGEERFKLVCAGGQLKLAVESVFVGFKPTEVIDTTYEVHTNGVKVTGTTVYVDQPAYVVYTANDDYIFTNGQTVVTNFLDTSKNPAVNVTVTDPPVHMEYVAEVDGVQYTSFAKAYAAVDSESDDTTTIRLLKDIEAAETVKIEKNVKLDLNGRNYSGPKGGSFNVFGSTFEIVGTNTVTGTITTNETGKVVLYGGVYDTDVNGLESDMCQVDKVGEMYAVVPKVGTQDPTPVKNENDEVVGTIAVSNSALVAAGVTTNELNNTGRNDMKVWEAIVLNLDPNDSNSRVIAKHAQQLDEKKISVNVPMVPLGDATQVPEASVVYELYGGNDKDTPVESWTKLGESKDPNFTIERKGYRYYAVIARIVIAEPVVMCTVTFNLDGGSWSLPTTYKVKKGEMFDIPEEEPLKDGYLFSLWRWPDGDFSQPGEGPNIDEDVTLTATWDEVEP